MARPRRARDPIAPASTSVTAVVGALPRGAPREPFGVGSLAEHVELAGSADGEVGDALRLFFANGGETAVVSAWDPVRPFRALDALADADLDLLVVPPTGRMSGPKAASLATAAALLADDRGAFYVADPPAVRTAANVARWARSFGGGRSTAVYFPRLLVRDREGIRQVAASGAVAGVFARIDGAHGVWTAPAGTRAPLRGTAGVAAELQADVVQRLAGEGVNAVRRLPSGPVRLWSARTRAEDDPEWKYVNVRRFVLFLERSIEEGTQWAVFEPNAEPLWREIRAAVENFLTGLWRQGAMPAAKPEEAFFVRCDRTTMTQDDIDSGRLVLLVGVAPVRPAEFVLVRIGLWARPNDDD